MASPESHHSEDQETQRERLLPGAHYVLWSLLSWQDAWFVTSCHQTITMCVGRGEVFGEEIV